MNTVSSIFLEKNEEELRLELYQQIGQLKVELDWLKKITNTPLKRKEC